MSEEEWSWQIKKLPNGSNLLCFVVGSLQRSGSGLMWRVMWLWFIKWRAVTDGRTARPCRHIERLDGKAGKMCKWRVRTGEDWLTDYPSQQWRIMWRKWRTVTWFNRNVAWCRVVRFRQGSRSMNKKKKNRSNIEEGCMQPDSRWILLLCNDINKNKPPSLSRLEDST